MAARHPIDRYAVVALFTAVDVGVTFRRVDWPAHVTLASNFVTDASADDVEQSVRSGAGLSHALTFEFGSTALFGLRGDMPVRLVVAGPAEELHVELARRLEHLPGFVADEPAFWRDGYRPHLTFGRAVPREKFARGDRHTARCIAIARLDRHDATITAVVDLSTAPVSAHGNGQPPPQPEAPLAARDGHVEVRLASAADAPALAALKAEWAQPAIAPSRGRLDEFADDIRAWIERHGERAVVALAQPDGVAVGMAWMVVFERAPDISDRHRLTADIQSVYVTPAARGRGLGRLLVDLLCREADHRMVPRILVSASARSTTLYERAGFTASPLLLQRTRPERADAAAFRVAVHPGPRARVSSERMPRPLAWPCTRARAHETRVSGCRDPAHSAAAASAVLSPEAPRWDRGRSTARTRRRRSTAAG